MLIPIRCFTCAKVLADKYNYYLRRVEEEEEKERNADGARAGAASSSANKDVKKKKTINGMIMDEMGADDMCCRSILLSTTKLVDKI